MRENKNIYETTRTYVDVFMGVLYIIIAFFVFKIPELRERFGNSTVYIFFALFLIYGIWRTYRGVVAILKSTNK